MRARLDAARRSGWLVSLLAVLTAFVLGGLLIAVTDPGTRAAAGYLFARPQDTVAAGWSAAVDAYGAMLRGAVFDPQARSSAAAVRPITETLTVASPLIAAGLGVALAFRAGLFNIGAQGQLIVGALLAGVVGFGLDLPAAVHLPLAVLAGLVGGALWGGVVGLLRARTGAHEVIVTIMLNYVAVYLLAYLLTTPGFQRGGSANPVSPPVADSASLPLLLGPSFRLHLGLLAVLVAAAVVWWLLERSTLGFSWRAVGANPDAARTAGISVSWAFVGVMLAAGALAGLGGAVQLLGTEKSLTGGIAGQIGFDAITVALLGRSRPLGVVLAGLLFGALRAGGVLMQASTGTPVDIVLVVQSVIVLLIAAPPLVRTVFRLERRRRPAPPAPPTAPADHRGREGRSVTSIPTATTAPSPAGGQGSDAAPADRPSARPVWTYAVLTAVAAVLFGALAPEGSSTFRLSGRSDAVQVPDLPLPAAPAGWLVVLVCAAVVVLVERDRRAGRRTGWWAPAVFAAAWLVGFLVWVVAGQTISLVGLLAGGLVLSVPLVLGALGGVVSERAGVVNIAIEGQLLAGAFGAAVVASATSSAWAGLVAAPLAGALVALLLAVFAIRYLVNQIIVGVVLNVLVVGLTSYLFSTVLSGGSGLNSPPGLLPVRVPLLADIPVLGPVLFDQSPIVYLTYVLVAAVHVALFRTRWGLRVRAVGEHPRAADTVGIDVNRTRFVNVLVSGALAGLGGAMLTLGVGLAFGEEMSAGKGYIALAAMIFGRYTPVGALVAALLFGVATNLQDILASISTPVPSQFLLMAPYLATVFAVAGLVGRVRAPAAGGEPYAKQ